MSGSLDAIKRVIAAFERSDWAEIDVRAGDVRVHLATGSPSTAPAAPREVRSAPPRSHRAADASDGATSSAAGGEHGEPSTATPPAGAHVVVSPSPGICWRSPEPGAPPFADVGDTVDASSTVCIVEVMKLMSHVKASVSGEVVAVYGRNGVAVHKGEPLFAIAPSGSPS